MINIAGRILSGIFWIALGAGAGYLIADAKSSGMKKAVGYVCDE